MEQRFETFTVQIAKISRNIRRIKSEEMAEFNLKSPHVSCLYYLYQSETEMTAKELCDVCEEDKASISRSIDFLENEGYIECRSKTEKRYKSPLYLTEKGKLVGEKIAQKVNDIVNMASPSMTDGERIKFYQILTKISNNLQKICDNYGE
ncbi:MAG: winged helix DNA-binding protein [Clostridia bacterium]|nr:winged helix DNA-binding protein [Clostridia bacterium]